MISSRLPVFASKPAKVEAGALVEVRYNQGVGR